MKKITSFLVIGICISFLSCSAWLDDNQTSSANTTGGYNSQKFQNIISSALYEVDNINIYQKESDFLGKIISTQGHVYLQQFLENSDRLIRVIGSNKGYTADYILHLDNPLPKQSRIDQNMQVLTSGRNVRVFGRFIEVEDYMLTDGTTKKLPALDCLAIFNKDDREF
jgi:hypothetical protein